MPTAFINPKYAGISSAQPDVQAAVEQGRANRLATPEEAAAMRVSALSDAERYKMFAEVDRMLQDPIDAIDAYRAKWGVMK